MWGSPPAASRRVCFTPPGEQAQEQAPGAEPRSCVPGDMPGCWAVTMPRATHQRWFRVPAAPLSSPGHRRESKGDGKMLLQRESPENTCTRLSGGPSQRAHSGLKKGEQCIAEQPEHDVSILRWFSFPSFPKQLPPFKEAHKSLGIFISVALHPHKIQRL